MREVNPSAQMSPHDSVRVGHLAELCCAQGGGHEAVQRKWRWVGEVELEGPRRPSAARSGGGKVGRDLLATPVMPRGSGAVEDLACRGAFFFCRVGGPSA